jgi:hypothetical protein
VLSNVASPPCYHALLLFDGRDRALELPQILHVPVALLNSNEETGRDNANGKLHGNAQIVQFKSLLLSRSIEAEAIVRYSYSDDGRCYLGVNAALTCRVRRHTYQTENEEAVRILHCGRVRESGRKAWLHRFTSFHHVEGRPV